MLNIQVRFHHNQPQIDVDINEPSATLNTAASVTNWVRQGWDIVCWGEVSQRTQDATIIRQIMNGEKPVAWGRSWIAVNHFRQQVVAGTDQLGLFPIWIAEDDDETILTNHRSQLIHFKDANSLNADSARHLVAFGQLFGDQSLWQGITMLPGRTQVILSPKTSMSRHTDTSPLLSNWETRFDDALDALVEAVRHCFDTDPQPLMSLSGGLDSRLLLAAASALGKKPTGLTYGQADSGDVRIARALADAMGLSLFTGGNNTDLRRWEHAKRVAELGGGEVPLHHAHAVLDEQLLAQTAGRVLITGTGAETSRAFYYDRGMPGYSLLGQPHLSDALMPRAKDYIAQEFMKTAEPFFAFAPQHRSALLASLQAQIAQHEHAFNKPAMFLDNFYLQNRVPRMVANGQQLLDSHYMRCHPFLNKDALFYMAHLPVRFKLGSTFHRKAIARLAPKLGDIHWDKTNLPLNKGLPLAHRYPALASRLGMDRWGKAVSGMFDYQTLLRDAPQAMLQKSVTKLGCLPVNNQDERWQLIRSHLPLVSYSTVWSYLSPAMDTSVMQHSA